MGSKKLRDGSLRTEKGLSDGERRLEMAKYTKRILKIEKMTKIRPGITEIQAKMHGHSHSK